MEGEILNILALQDTNIAQAKKNARDAWNERRLKKSKDNPEFSRLSQSIIDKTCRLAVQFYFFFLIYLVAFAYQIFFPK